MNINGINKKNKFYTCKSRYNNFKNYKNNYYNNKFNFNSLLEIEKFLYNFKNACKCINLYNFFK